MRDRDNEEGIKKATRFREWLSDLLVYLSGGLIEISEQMIHQRTFPCKHFLMVHNLISALSSDKAVASPYVEFRRGDVTIITPFFLVSLCMKHSARLILKAFKRAKCCCHKNIYAFSLKPYCTHRQKRFNIVTRLLIVDAKRHGQGA